MTNKTPIIVGAAAFAFISGAALVAQKSNAGDMTMGAKGKTEKCAGIVKAMKNDCAANGHSCAGMAKRDNDPNEWISLPNGACSKITNGRVIR